MQVQPALGPCPACQLVRNQQSLHLLLFRHHELVAGRRTTILVPVDAASLPRAHRWACLQSTRPHQLPPFARSAIFVPVDLPAALGLQRLGLPVAPMDAIKLIPGLDVELNRSHPGLPTKHAYRSYDTSSATAASNHTGAHGHVRTPPHMPFFREHLVRFHQTVRQSLSLAHNVLVCPPELLITSSVATLIEDSSPKSSEIKVGIRYGPVCMTRIDGHSNPMPKFLQGTACHPETGAGDQAPGQPPHPCLVSSFGRPEMPPASIAGLMYVHSRGRTFRLWSALMDLLRSDATWVAALQAADNDPARAAQALWRRALDMRDAHHDKPPTGFVLPGPPFPRIIEISRAQ